ncbi:MAG: YicC/YloC family endoribonuclease [Candidatus Zixiibacteriota bacterium]
MNSMTGFGKAEIRSKLGNFLVEVSSVNNRYLEVSTRLPRQFMVFESRIKEYLNEQVERGKLSIYVGFEVSADSAAGYTINKEAARAYHRQLMSLKKELKLEGGIEIEDLLQFPAVIEAGRETYDDDALWAVLKKALTKAVEGLLAMRTKEGAAMAKDMDKRLHHMEKCVEQVEKNAVLGVSKYRDRLQKQVEDLLARPMDAGRLEMEVAMLAEKTDISEECTRFHSHLAQYWQALKSKDTIGKRLNFILQEMNREANTMSSKTTELDITKAVISLKEEIEKLREMAQNVE